MKVIDRDIARHAVIGGVAPEQSAALADTAEFYEILYAGIYSNGRLAMVREIICNAHDAHVQAGVAAPIEVEVTETHFIVRDHGSGIPRRKMRDVYMTFGASTKLDDNKATGGFGLGAKAPWAYTDHFTVISECEGERVVYACSKGSAESGGKPASRPMAVSPTKRTGLTVKAPLKAGFREQTDVRSLAKRVIREGNIYATVDSHVEATYDYEGIAKRGYWWHAQGTRLNVSIKIATVLYPLPNHDDIEACMNRLNNTWLKGTFIIEDPDNGIKPTPSRETVNATPSAVARIVKLLTAIAHDFESVKNSVIREAVKLAAEDYDKPKSFLDSTNDMSVVAAYCYTYDPCPIKVAKEQGRFNREAALAVRFSAAYRRWSTRDQLEYGLGRGARRDAVRIALRAGVEPRLYTTSDNAAAMPLVKARSIRNKPGVLYVAPRVKDFEACIRQRHKSGAYKYQRKIGLVVPSLDTHLDEIRAQAARLGWRVVVAPAPPKPVSRKAIPLKCVIAKGIRDASNPRAAAFHYTTADAGTAPIAYVEVKELKEGHATDTVHRSTLRLILQLRGPVALCYNATAVKALVKAGTPSAREVAKELALFLIGNPSFLARLAVKSYGYPAKLAITALIAAFPEKALSLLGLRGTFEEVYWNAADDASDLLRCLDREDRRSKRRARLEKQVSLLADWLCSEGIDDALMHINRLKNAELKSKLTAAIFDEIEQWIKLAKQEAAE